MTGYCPQITPIETDWDLALKGDGANDTSAWRAVATLSPGPRVAAADNGDIAAATVDGRADG